MKAEERKQAVNLRQQGYSYSQILQMLPVAQGTLSRWLRDVELQPQQIETLQRRSGSNGIGKPAFVKAMRAKRNERWSEFQNEADREFETLKHNPEFMFGLALYVGEGSKRQEGRVALANCDPRVIRKAIEFFALIGVPKARIACALQIHDEQNIARSEEFWCRETGLESSQFRKTICSISRTSGRKMGCLQPYGTCYVRFDSVRLWQKLLRWMDLSLTDAEPAG